MVARNVFMRNFPIISVKAFEGTITRYTNSVAPTGGINEGAAVYQYPIAKGDLVKLKDHTDKGIILVEEAAAGDNIVHGMAVSDPSGIDNVTASGGTPALAQQRVVDVAFIGLGVIELTVSATGAVSPGDVVGLDADEPHEVEVEHDYSGGAVIAGDNAKMVALTYAAAGEKVALLVGSIFDVVN